MSFFGTHDPLAVSIRIRLMRTLPRIEKLAEVKNSEVFRKRMMELVDTGHTAHDRRVTQARMRAS